MSEAKTESPKLRPFLVGDCLLMDGKKNVKVVDVIDRCVIVEFRDVTDKFGRPILAINADKLRKRSVFSV